MIPKIIHQTCILKTMISNISIKKSTEKCLK